MELVENSDDNVHLVLPKLKEYFGSGIGLKFQRIDSDIAETTMLHFAKENIPILPVHDSFIMHRTHRDELEAVMSKAYKEVMSSSIPIKTEMAESKRPRMIQSATSVGFGFKKTISLTSKGPTEDQRRFGAYEKRLRLAYKLCVVVTFETGGAEIQRRIWPI